MSQQDILNISVFESEYDILDNLKTKRISLYDNLGYVELIDMMPRTVPHGRTADIAISRNARVSYASGDKTDKEDAALVRYLVENFHNTPIESVVLKFRIKIPQFVKNQLIRHRTASVNEQSFRYTVPKEDIYAPPLRMQSKNNKQGSSDETPPPEAVKLYEEMGRDAHETYKKYEALVQMGVAREVARCYLPVNIMTELMWQINLHNLLHFLQLRMDEHAQKEIRDLATAMLDLIRPLVPYTVQAFEDFRINSTAFDAEELRYLNSDGSVDLNNRKATALSNKLERLNLVRNTDIV